VNKSRGKIGDYDDDDDYVDFHISKLARLFIHYPYAVYAYLAASPVNSDLTVRQARVNTQALFLQTTATVNWAFMCVSQSWDTVSPLRCCNSADVARRDQFTHQLRELAVYNTLPAGARCRWPWLWSDDPLSSYTLVQRWQLQNHVTLMSRGKRRFDCVRIIVKCRYHTRLTQKQLCV
jgi:hypothetical protein